MKLILLAILIAYLGVTESQNCTTTCRPAVEYLCGRTLRNGRMIYCTYRNPCEMYLHACQKREEWKKHLTGRCPRDSEECRL
ncbi:uncharacterized protein LOC110187798 [Drosophila serrata]|uniref:uncharacterized protein LOC110187798 n=1 Tax=Drosophila serrata TaxID=7274 RepID=UPI000A1D381B|nr:uncharacterized protein LOC110187798 [Drosophila serrata]